MNTSFVEYEAHPQKLLRRIIEGMNDMVAALDMSFCFIAFNEAYQREIERLFQVRIEIGSSLLDALSAYPEDQARAAELWGRALRGDNFSIVQSFGDPSRERNYYEIAYSPIYDEEGHLIGAVDVARNVTDRVHGERALAEALRRLRAIFNNSYHLSGLLSPDGILLETNDMSLQMYGFKHEEEIGKPFWTTSWFAHTPELQERVRLGIERAADGEFVHFEHLSPLSENETVLMDFSINPVKDETGKVIFLIPEARPIPEQMKARLELEELFQSTFEQAAVGIAHVAKDGAFTRLNRVFCELLGYRYDELMGKTFQEVTHPDDRDKDLELYSRLLSKEIPSYTIEKRYIRKEGSHIWINLTSSIVWDEHGEFKYAIKVIEDISGKKQAEKDLQVIAHRQKILSKLAQRALSGHELPELMSQAVQLLPGILDVDHSAVLKLVNEGSQFLLKAGYGWPAEAIDQVVGPADARSQSGYTLLLDEPVVVNEFSGEFRFSILDFLKDEGLSSGMSVVIYGPGKAEPYGILIVHSKKPRTFTPEELNFLQAVSNILALAIERYHSEQKILQFNQELEQRVQERTRQLEHVSREKSRLLALVSHDFKTPLAAIIRFVEILEKEGSDLSEKQATLIGYIKEGVQQLRAMVTDILDRARIESGQVKARPENIPIAGLLNEVLRAMTVLADEREIRLKTEIQPGLDEVEVDPVLLKQILANLVSNAVKYNKRNGKVWIRVSRDEERQMNIFEVQDTGIGIPADKIPNLFQEFYRVGIGLNSVEGSGLGLASTRKLVELLQGTMQVDSIEGQGSTFTIRLPVHLVQKAN
jgi:PAS domain S-box-containing protein